MPCYVTGSGEGDEAMYAEESRKKALAATKAACELIRTHNINYHLLSKPTLQWVREHEKLDKKRRK